MKAGKHLHKQKLAQEEKEARKLRRVGETKDPGMLIDHIGDLEVRTITSNF